MTPAELAAARDRMHLSQVGLARVLGVASNTVNRWEAGSRAIPSFLPLALVGLRHHRHELHNPRNPDAEPCCPQCCDCGS